MFNQITACVFAKFLKEPSTPEASAASLPPRLLQLLPAGAKVAGRDSHPLKDSALARRTKHQGYHYEHAFALDWNAMKGYHLLMRLAHVFNTLARFTRQLRDLYQQLGVRGAIAFIRSSCAAPWLDPARIRLLLAEPFLLQLE